MRHVRSDMVTFISIISILTIMLAVAVGVSFANHEGDGAVHCEYMHSHPNNHQDAFVPEGYKHLGGYVHCHRAPQTTPKGHHSAAPTPTATSVPTVTPEPTPTAMPTPTATSTPEPTAMPTQEPTVEVSLSMPIGMYRTLCEELMQIVSLRDKTQREAFYRACPEFDY